MNVLRSKMQPLGFAKMMPTSAFAPAYLEGFLSAAHYFVSIV